MKKLMISSSVGALALAMGAAPALAQETSSAASAGAATQDAEEEAQPQQQGIGDIVITATRRDTALQSTPVSVSVVDDTLIDQASPDDIGDLAVFVPNFSAETITGFNAASFAMRGVGQNNIIVYFEPPVVVLVDDFVMPSVQTQLLDTFDVQQVEVLRGPQGTLFGKNSSGGAVTVRTKRPELGSTFVDAEFTYGSFETFNAKGAFNAALGDSVALRLVMGYENSEGYYKNNACYGPVVNLTDDFNTPVFDPAAPSPYDGAVGCLDDGAVGGTDVFNMRAKLLVEPNDTISALFQYEMLRDRSDTVPSVNENDAYTGTVPFLTDILGLNVPNQTSDDPLDNSGITLRDDTFQRDIQRIDVDGLYANIDFNFDAGTLTSVTGWRQQKSRLPNSYAGVSAVGTGGERLSVFDATRDDDRETFQQELRFASDFEGPFNFVAGGFYQTDDTDFCVSQLLGFLDLTGGPLPFGNWNDTPYILCNAQEATSYALFAEGTYEFNEKLTLTAGLRQSWDEKTWRGRQQTFIPALEGGFDLGITIDDPLDASVYNFPAGVITVEDESDRLTYRLSLGYEANDDLFLYATHATGYKGGGFNDQIGGFAAFGTDLAAFAEAARATDPETASSFEAGVKADFADDRIRLNVTGFYVEYSDLQKQLNVPIVVNGNPNQVTIFVNAASATVKGIEAELTAQPTDGLTFRGILGYQDGEYDEYDAPNAGYDLATAPLDRAPEWQWTLDATYDRPISSHWDVIFNVNLAHQSSSLFTQAIDDPLGNTFLQARTLLNASLTLAEADDKFFVRLIGQNLTDERYRTASQNVAGLWLNSQYGPPRFFGVQAGFSFGE